MKHIITVCMLVILCASCTNDEYDNGSEKGTLSFSLVSSDNATRAPGEDDYNENKTERLDIFFFDKNGQVLFYPSEDIISQLGNKVSIDMPEDAANSIFKKDVILYVLANCNLTRDVLSGKTKAQIEALVQENAASFNPDTFEPQKNFLMDGELDINISSMLTPDLGKVTLKRAAAKIVVDVLSANVDGYTAIKAGVRFNNYLNKTSIGSKATPIDAQETDYKHSAFRSIEIPGTETGSFDSTPFYSYANEWEFKSTKESYITLVITWKEKATGKEKDYYYKVPFNYIPDNGENTELYRLLRNYIYHFKLDIKVLGGLDPSNLIELNPSFQLKDWTTKRIEVDINQYDYLLVSEHDIEIHDITDKTIEYTSSKPVRVEVDSVFHYQYLYSGEIKLVKYQPGDNRYPTFTINTDNNTITMTSPVPINYVPLMIHFTVRNEAGLYQKVKLIQYPRQYITSQYSTGIINKIPIVDGYTNNGQGQTGMKNFNLYTITTTSLAAEDNFSLGGDMMTEVYDDYYRKNMSVTKMDEQSNNIISPRFVVASQRGITTQKSFINAQRRCMYYGEGPYDQGTWRMPTLAEMLLLSRIQGDENSALKNLFVPAGSRADTWWSSRNDYIASNHSRAYSVRMVTGEVLSYDNYRGSNPSGGAVRCVRDIWKD